MISIFLIFIHEKKNQKTCQRISTSEKQSIKTEYLIDIHRYIFFIAVYACEKQNELSYHLERENI
jgi:hypothetical protein